MKFYLPILFSNLLILLSPVGGFAEPAQSLFNGRDFAGWSVFVEGKGRVDKQDFFTVADGIIHAYQSQEAGSRQPFAALVTDEGYGNYALKLEFCWGKKKFPPRDNSVRDAGVLFHVHDTGPFWPSSVELQIQEGDVGDIWAINTQLTSLVNTVEHTYSPHGKKYTRGDRQQRYARFSRSHSWEQPGWNQLEIIAKGDHAIYRVNGHTVNEVLSARQWDDRANAYVPLDHGRIALQAEGAEIMYRNIALTPLQGK